MQKDNPCRFEELVIPHLALVRSVARRLLRNEDDAQDAVQETCLRAARFFHIFDGADARAWLLAIVRNTCFTFLRQRAVRASMVVFDERIHFGQWTNAERALMEQEDLSTLRRGIASLPSRLRNILVMREVHQLTYEQIAKEACIPVGTVMSRLSRARHELRAAARRPAA